MRGAAPPAGTMWVEMGILRRIEARLESVFEGAFSRTFKSNVQPVELARKLAKEMDEHKTISVSQVYVPNIYTVYLAEKDRAQFATYEASLRTELASYLGEHARREGYTLPGRLRVLIETAEELDIGSFGIATETREDRAAPPVERRPAAPSAAPAPAAVPASPPEPADLPPEFLADGPGPAVTAPESVPVAAAAVAPLAPGAPAGARPDEDGPGAADGGDRDDADPAAPAAPRPDETMAVSASAAAHAGLTREEWALVWPGGRYVIDRRSVVIGRGRDCDVVIADSNTSRRHAELVREGAGFVLRDLGSTNGSAVNGRRTREAPVAPGDAITIGTTTLKLESRRT